MQKNSYGGVFCLFLLVADAGTSFCWKVFYILQPDFILYFKLCEIKETKKFIQKKEKEKKKEKGKEKEKKERKREKKERKTKKEKKKERKGEKGTKKSGNFPPIHFIKS